MSGERVERRLAAILAADVVGYSWLMGNDEEGALAALKTLQRELIDPKVKEHCGRLVKTTGDGALVEFASVVDAVRCAVEMQRAMAERNAGIPAERRIDFRIGINLGDIIIDEGDIYGDGVNVAARLEALAEPGGICVSRAVRDQVRDKLDFSFEDLGEQQVKNIARAVRVYRVPIDGTAAATPSAPAVPERPSIAVLPFQNMSAAPEQEYFADGTITYVEFAAAVRGALRDLHSPDLLARNPLLHNGIGNLDGSAGPSELRALLSEVVGTLFGNPRDEKLRRIIELTYFQPAPKQEAVAERLSLSFGTYRRHLATARDRLARWLWDNWQAASIQPGTAGAAVEAKTPDGETTTPPETGAPAAPRLSLVILPFDNICGSAQDDAFVDGITETLTTDLSRSSGVFAISRKTAFAYKGRPMDIRQIGRELSVRYVLEGSIQCAGDRLRINAQLVDAESGANLWAERFDKQRTDLLDMQDEVTTRLARAVHIALIAAESRCAARGHPDRLDAVDHALRGLAAWNQPLSLEAARQARQFFEAALRLDKHNIAALLGVANAHMWEVNIHASDDRDGQIRAAETAVTKALALVPDSADAHVAYGTVLFAQRAPERALREFNLALEIDSNFAVAHAYLGVMKYVLGRPGESGGHVKEAMRLSPRDPLLFYWHFVTGLADFYFGQVVRGIESLRKSVEIYPNWPLAQFALAGALALAGRLAEAAEVCTVARRIAPNFTIAKFRDETMSDNPVYLAQREYLYQGLRLAGVPEG